MSKSGVLLLLTLAACGRLNFDASRDGGVAEPDAGPLAHVEIRPGWTVEVFHDFSAKHEFRTADFIDGPDVYSNLPTSLFILEAPFPRLLGMTAGRQLIEIGRTEYIVHDYGMHPPDTTDVPDGLLDGVYVPNLDNNGPALLLASSSANTGDGTFRVKPDYSIGTDINFNNVRAVIWDETGAFDAKGVPEGYLLAQTALERRSDTTAIITGDVGTGRIVGSDIIIAEILPGADTVVHVASIPPISVSRARARRARHRDLNMGRRQGRLDFVGAEKLPHWKRVYRPRGRMADVAAP